MLAAFRQTQKWPQFCCQAHTCYFRDKCVVFARNCKFENLTQFANANSVKFKMSIKTGIMT